MEDDGVTAFTSFLRCHVGLSHLGRLAWRDSWIVPQDVGLAWRLSKACWFIQWFIIYICIYIYIHMFITTCIVSVSVLAVVILLILQGLGDIMMDDVWLAAVYNSLLRIVWQHLHPHSSQQSSWHISIELFGGAPLGFHAGLPACLALCDGDAGSTWEIKQWFQGLANDLKVAT